MLRTLNCLLLLLFIVTSAFPQETELPHKYLDTINHKFPINSIDVRAVGMGNTQIANGNTFNAMMYNPAFLGTSKKSFEVFGFQMGMPPTTYDAAFFLLDHMDEFEDAVRRLSDCPVTRIGTIVSRQEGTGLYSESDQPIELPQGAYDHFAGRAWIK